MANCDPSREIRIRRVGESLGSDLTNISSHLGITDNGFLKPLLPEVIAAFPEHMKHEKAPCQPCNEMRIRGISKKVKEELQNIADYIGVDVGSLIKVKLAEKAGTFPQRMKMQMLK